MVAAMVGVRGSGGEWSFTGRKGRMEEILREPGNFRGRSLGGNTLEDGAMDMGLL